MYKTTYDKNECQTGVVHIGYGAFHRAHQAVYIDDYMEKTGDLRWGIVAVNLRNEGFREINEYVLKTPSSYRMVRSHLDYIDWTKNRTVAKHMLTLPSVKLVTITVTERVVMHPVHHCLSILRAVLEIEGLRSQSCHVTIFVKMDSF